MIPPLPAAGCLTDKHRQTITHATPSLRPPERRHLQAVHLRRVAGHLPVAVQAAAGGPLHRRRLCQRHALLPAGGLPLPGHAGPQAKVLLRLDVR